MLQDIYPHQLKNEFIANPTIHQDDIVILYKDNHFLFSLSNNCFPSVKDISTSRDLIYLFKLDDTQFFLCQNGTYNVDDFTYVSFYEIKRCLEPHYQFALYTAKHLASWYQTNQYCGCCQKPLSHSKTQRALVCTCGNTIYPRLNPAVIVGVICNDKILITRYANGYKFNALVAGFVEIGETMEQAVYREVLEETGIHVKNIQYYKSQPWGVSGDILLGYYCQVDGDDTICIDANELKEALWLEADQIELQPENISLTNEMMAQFKKLKSNILK